MKISEAIERRFRNIDIEYQLAAVAMKRLPHVLVAVQAKWFTVVPLQKLCTVLQKHKAVMTKEAALQELRKVDPKEFEVLRSAIERVEAVHVKELTEKSAQLLVKQLYEMYESRRCLAGVQQVVTSLGKFNLEKAKATFRDLAKTVQMATTETSGEYVEDFEQRVELVKLQAERARHSESGIGGIPTGIVPFDRLIGGVMPSEFGVIAGKPNVGKTAALTAIAVHAWLQGYNILFASGEMSKPLIQFRIDANVAGIPLTKFRTGEILPDEWKRWKRVIEQFRLTQQSFFEVTSFPRDFTAQAVEEEIYRVQDKWGKAVHLLCIDYLNIMRPVREISEDSRTWGAQAGVVWDVKGLVAEVNGGIACWSAGQVTDEGMEAEHLEMQHVKYARAIAETAPIVVGIVQTEEDELEKRLQWQVLKMRNAERLDRPLYLHPNMQLMRLHEDALRKRSLLALEDQFAAKGVRRKRRGRSS